MTSSDEQTPSRPDTLLRRHDGTLLRRWRDDTLLRRWHDDTLLRRWRREFGPQPSGWDFSSLDGRMSEDPVPWDLDAEYRTALADAQHVLDMGTGGGEHLSRFADLLPADTVATEGWSGNIATARRQLGPLGIQVVEFGASDEPDDHTPMPFPDDRFDLVLNRHEACSARELARVIQPGGVFLTQQVGGNETAELDWIFGDQRVRYPHVNHEQFVADLEAAGFRVVDGANDVAKYRFTDVAALVAYWRLVPWEVPPEFDVDRYRDELLELHRRTEGGPVELTRIRFWIKAVRL